MKKRNASLAGAMLLLLAVPPLKAECPLDGATPLTIGPVNPINGFPEYVVDSQGTAVQLCLNSIDGQGTPPNCFFDPPLVGNAISDVTGFGAEAFWWSSDATITTAAGLDALLVMAVEAAYLNGDPAAGEQFPFTRLRVRMDVPTPGIYTVTHPYGQLTYTVGAVGAGQEVRDSFDIEFAPDSVHQGRVGPLLAWDATPPSPPIGFLGDGVTEHSVTGSPCGTNYFRVEAVALDGVTAIDLTGTGENAVQTDLFLVTGQRFDGVVQTPLSASRTTYERGADGQGQVDLFALSATTASVNASGAPNLPTGAHPLSTTGDGHFQTTVILGDASTVPATVTLTANNTGNDQSVLTSALVDVVTITRADYDLTSGTLVIEAQSSDQLSLPILTAANGLGNLSGGILSLPLPIPPASVTVMSSAGGVDTEPVRLIVVPVAGNRPPVAQIDTVSTSEDVTATFNLLADNGAGADFDPDAPANDIDPTTLQVGASPLGGLINNGDGTVTYTPPTNFSGTDSFSYTVRDTLGAFSNSARVTITVSAVNDPPVAVDDIAATVTSTPVTIAVLANDSDPDGDPLAVTAVTQGGNGVVSHDGVLVTYTPNAGFTGTDNFTYTISDGVLAATAIVTVTVTQAGDTLTVTRAEFRSSQARWDIRGTTVVPGPGNTVTIYIGTTATGTVLGTATVNTAGAWRFANRGSAIVPDGSQAISVKSTAGGELDAIQVSVTP